jgi:hypothetical protein
VQRFPERGEIFKAVSNQHTAAISIRFKSIKPGDFRHAYSPSKTSTPIP